ncbi:L,D-transpeptidase [Rubrivirga sp. SAORIC476]|uniref:L,D-transpeptidase n=1 Tax=Rubrivirga sp. SAORIC476 TaxID=1961794 RepID=UPI000BA9541B|nr:L,D-transpeptidase [Rubrivirga sp. SAORIC476]MAQ93271.1 murein L,D-transpeptidase [Rhodothermaceae bacterium]MBC14434.1 murein L,D-transpeptidase [Rhodothermaceae bacterium]PAP81155.1 L,D-transpeptidase [Rubrivirga sp. SAORIC476]
MPLRFLLLAAVALVGLAAVPTSQAQSERSLYNQDRLAELLYANRVDDIAEVPVVSYRYHTLAHESGNSILARHMLYEEVGDGDAREGRDRLNGMVAFLNGVFISDLRTGDTIVLPSQTDVDPRAFSPFPRDYPGARDFDKLFVIDKSVQAWAGYENGRLARWGLVSTGAEGSETPNGRFNFNWKELHRVSTLSPPGQSWDMRWVFNFHDARGIHVHQYYALPTTGAASHGCVRLMTADAQWIYNWADGWRTTNGGAERAMASRGRILEQGTTVLVLGEAPDGAPQRFRDVDGTPELIRVDLPDDPYSVRPGTDQQVRFDRLRRQQASS